MGDSLESLHAMHGRGQPWIYWISLVGIAAALGALPLIPVEVTIRAAGIVRPTTERIELKAAVSGRIARVLARDNGRVEAGEPLLELVALDVQERIARNQTLQREKSELIADLQQLTSTPFLPTNANVSASDLGADLPGLRTPVLAQGRAQFLTQLHAAELAFDKARLMYQRAATLADKGLVSGQELDDARFSLARASTDLRQLVEQARSSWQTQSRDEQIALA